MQNDIITQKIFEIANPEYRLILFKKCTKLCIMNSRKDLFQMLKKGMSNSILRKGVLLNNALFFGLPIYT